MQGDNRQFIQRGLRVQTVLAMLLAAGLMLVSPVAAYSSMFGSLAAFLPALVFAILVAPKIGPDSATFLRAVMIGEALKLLVMALICVLVFVYVKPLAAGWFFAGMIVGIVSGRIASSP